MAELSPSPGKSGGNHRVKRIPLRVDLTAMVDLAFLLITFFMLTTSLKKPKEIPVVMPSGHEPGPVSDKRTMTICLGKNNRVLWYLGLTDKPIIAPTLTSCGKGIRTAIMLLMSLILPKCLPILLRRFPRGISIF